MHRHWYFFPGRMSGYLSLDWRWMWRELFGLSSFMRHQKSVRRAWVSLGPLLIVCEMTGSTDLRKRG